MAVPRFRSYEGPAILSYGFRPFFLLGSAYAGLSILFWVPAYSGLVETSSLFAPVDWHVHEMLFGYLAAVVTGFLLTAIPNWTGRLPVLGLPLLALVVLWVAGRIAVFFSGFLGWQVAVAIDCSFLAAVAVVTAREIVSGRNWRNLKVLAPLTILLVANICFHMEAHLFGISDVSRRLGLSAALLLIMIIGGRIIPSFTRNWLARENPGRLPAPFGHFDTCAIAISAGALVWWCGFPEASGAAITLAAAAALQVARLARWAGDRTFADPLVLILHFCLRLHSHRHDAGGAFHPVSGNRPGSGRHPCNRQRRYRRNDARCDGEGDARAHRSPAAGRPRREFHLRYDYDCRSGQDRRRVRAGSSAHADRRRRLGGRFSGLRIGIRACARPAETALSG